MHNEVLDARSEVKLQISLLMKSEKGLTDKAKYEKSKSKVFGNMKELSKWISGGGGWYSKQQR